MEKTLKNFLRYTGRVIFSILLLIGLVFIPALWRHWVTYPRLEKQLSHLVNQRRQPLSSFKLHDFKGVLHNHCYWSHDSRGVLEEILPAALQANLNFIFFSDHPHSKLDTFPRALSGQFSGVLMIPGSETRRLLVWPLRKTVLDWGQPTEKVIQQVIRGGGLIFYAHTEQPHPWLNPDYQGMEIYNIHTDLKDENLITLLPEILINSGKFRLWTYRKIFDEQTAILARWDSLNTWRRIVGIAGNDAHNNQSLRARYLPRKRVEWVGPNAEALDTTRIGFKEKLLLHPPDAAGWAFRWEIDPYYASFHFVNTHILADTLTPAALAGGLKAGHVYIAFEGLATATGFLYYAAGAGSQPLGLMGDSLALDQIKTLQVESPLPGRIRIKRNGKILAEQAPVYQLSFSPQQPGTYRVEVALEIGGKWVPWIYSNPIYVVTPE